MGVWQGWTRKSLPSMQMRRTICILADDFGYLQSAAKDFFAAIDLITRKNVSLQDSIFSADKVVNRTFFKVESYVYRG
jgi:hypothetical protein